MIFFKPVSRNLIKINRSRSELRAIGHKKIVMFIILNFYFQNYKITLVKHKYVMHFYFSQSRR